MRVGDRRDVRSPSAVRFRGIDRTEFLDNRQFHGNAFSLLRAAERFLRDGLPIAGRTPEDRRLPNCRRGPHYAPPAQSWILRAFARHTDDES